MKWNISQIYRRLFKRPGRQSQLLQRRVRLGLEELEDRCVPSASPHMSMSVSAADPQDVSISYQIYNDPSVHQPLTLSVYRSASDPANFNPTREKPIVQREIATPGDSNEHSLTIRLPSKLAIDPSRPYVYATAVPHNQAYVGEAHFKKYILDVVSHGFEPIGAYPFFQSSYAWVKDMASSLQAQLGNNGYAMPFDWASESGLPAPGYAKKAADRMRDQVKARIANLVAKGSLGANDVVDMAFYVHSRGCVVASLAEQELFPTFVGSDLPQLKGSYIQMFLMDPHPANAADSAFDVGKYGGDAYLALVAFQKPAKDPEVVVAPRVDQADVYYQHTPCSVLTGFENTQFNLHGEMPVIGVTDPAAYHDLSNLTVNGKRIGHSEVHDWFQQNVINTTSAGLDLKQLIAAANSDLSSFFVPTAFSAVQAAENSTLPAIGSIASQTPVDAGAVTQAALPPIDASGWQILGPGYAGNGNLLVAKRVYKVTWHPSLFAQSSKVPYLQVVAPSTKLSFNAAITFTMSIVAGIDKTGTPYLDADQTYVSLSGNATGSTLTPISFPVGDLTTAATGTASLNVGIMVPLVAGHGQVPLPSVPSLARGTTVVSGKLAIDLSLMSSIGDFDIKVPWGAHMEISTNAGKITSSYSLHLPDMNSLKNSVIGYFSNLIGTAFTNAINGYLDQPVQAIGATTGALVGAGSSSLPSVSSGIKFAFNTQFVQAFVNGGHDIPILTISYSVSGQWATKPKHIPLAGPISLGPLVVTASLDLQATASWSFVLNGQLTTRGHLVFSQDSGLIFAASGSAKLAISALFFGVIGAEADAGLTISAGLNVKPTSTGINVSFQLAVVASVEVFIVAKLWLFELKARVLNFNVVLVSIDTSAASQEIPWSQAAVSIYQPVVVQLHFLTIP